MYTILSYWIYIAKFFVNDNWSRKKQGSLRFRLQNPFLHETGLSCDGCRDQRYRSHVREVASLPRRPPLHHGPIAARPPRRPPYWDRRRRQRTCRWRWYDRGWWRGPGAPGWRPGWCGWWRGPGRWSPTRGPAAGPAVLTPSCDWEGGREGGWSGWRERLEIQFYRDNIG